MKTTIYYFSGTGNCLKVARDLAAELEAEVAGIAKAISCGIDSSAERIGIVFPVYMFGLPLIVVDFLKKINFDKDKYVFAVATFGGLAGDSLGQVARLVEEKGARLAAGFLLRMPGNYTPLYGALPKEKQDQIFEKERRKVKEICRIIKNGPQYGIEKGPLFLNWFFSGIIYKSGASKMAVMDKDFWVNEKCNGCGICVKVCPVENVSLLQGKPHWGHKCQQCMACLQWCPQEAIESGKSTPGRKRYRNPDVTLDDLMAQRA